MLGQPFWNASRDRNNINIAVAVIIGSIGYLLAIGENFGIISTPGGELNL